MNMGTHNEKTESQKVLVIGLGQIGYSNAEYMTRRGLHVEGFDISEKAVKRALDDGVIQNRATGFAGYDYYFICISTHNPDDMFVPYQQGIFDLAETIAKEGKEGALLGIDSTITRGTTRKVCDIVGHKLHVVHVPHRFYIHEKDKHGVNQTRVLGGCESCCVEKGREFYGEMLGIPLHAVSAVETAELTKIVENTYRYVEIAFAEELKIFCDNSGISFGELRGAINTKGNIKILHAKKCIGGDCLPKDSQMFLTLTRNVLETSIIDAAKKIDLEYRRHIAGRPVAPMVAGA